MHILACQLRFWECGLSGLKLMPTSQTSRQNTKELLGKSPPTDGNPGYPNGTEPSAETGPASLRPAWPTVLGPAVQSAHHGSMVSLSSPPASSCLSQPRFPSTSSLMDAALAGTPLVPHLTWRPSFMLQLLLWGGAACCCRQRSHAGSCWGTPLGRSVHTSSPVLPTYTLGYSYLTSPHVLSHLAMPRHPAIYHLHYTLGYKVLEPERWRTG